MQTIQIVLFVGEVWTLRDVFSPSTKPYRRYPPTLEVEDPQSLGHYGNAKLSRTFLKIMAVQIRVNQVNRHEWLSACTMFRQHASTNIRTYSEIEVV